MLLNVGSTPEAAEDLDMTKAHLLYWIFDFLEQHHPEVLKDMRARIAGDAGDQWVPTALAERFHAYDEVRPAGFKFLGEFSRSGQDPVYRDFIMAIPNRKRAEEEARAHLGGAAKISMITLSRDDLTRLGLQEGQIRK
jgi:hypothetical protein